MSTRFVFHSIRHTFVTLAENAGVPDLTIRDLVGHARASVTSRYSGGTTLEVRAAAIEKLDFGQL